MNNKTHKLILLTFTAIFIFSAVTSFDKTAYAACPEGQVIEGSTGKCIKQSTGPKPTATITKIENPIKVNSIQDFVAQVLGIILKIGVPIVAVFIIFAGFKFVWAQGNPEKIEQAKSTLLYTLIGAAILLGAWMIGVVVKSTIDALMK